MLPSIGVHSVLLSFYIDCFNKLNRDIFTDLISQGLTRY
ncbi:hypothetical protein GECvBNS7_gp030c [Salmonella phage GEC_vB_NS7]|uniref:Uncharacterized protein n=1 Tax=Salmonella phage GEC_vB_NS7 TaxID=2777381 RepID=A0A7S9SQI1_9CAUD|nr:hypothetical protein GECvBNS7_gp030c [Salmonella phage GEC_vB_NS7]